MPHKIESLYDLKMKDLLCIAQWQRSTDPSD